MLVNHWNEIVAQYGEEIAVRGPDSDVSITFREIDQLAEQVDTSGEFVLAIGVSAGFFPAMIAAWRDPRWDSFDQADMRCFWG